MSEATYKDQIQDILNLFFWFEEGHEMYQKYLLQIMQSLISCRFFENKQLDLSSSNWITRLWMLIYGWATSRFYHSLARDNWEQYSRETRITKIELSQKTCLFMSEVLKPSFTYPLDYFKNNNIPISPSLEYLWKIINEIPTIWYREFIVRWLRDWVVHDDNFSVLKQYIIGNFLNNWISSSDLRARDRDDTLAVIRPKKLEKYVAKDLRTLAWYRWW